MFWKIQYIFCEFGSTQMTESVFPKAVWLPVHAIHQNDL